MSQSSSHSWFWLIFQTYFWYLSSQVIRILLKGRKILNSTQINWGAFCCVPFNCKIQSGSLPLGAKTKAPSSSQNRSKVTRWSVFILGGRKVKPRSTTTKKLSKYLEPFLFNSKLHCSMILGHKKVGLMLYYLREGKRKSFQ